MSTGARFPGVSAVDDADDGLVTTFKPVRPSTTDRPPIPAVPFRGSEAIATGCLTEYQLRTKCRRLFPDVYVDAMCVVTPTIMVRAAALWAPPGAVICGMGAALLHRERWYAPETVGRSTDIYCAGAPRSARGIRIRRHPREFPPGHLVENRGILFTSAARIAVDVGRWENDDNEAIAKIDAICNRSEIRVDALAGTVDQMRGLHGVNRVRSLLSRCDERAASPPETRLRLMLIRAGLPRPTPQLVIRNEYGEKIATADLGYEKQKVAIFYDSELHRDKSTWEFDAWANAQMAELGWERVRVTAQMMRTPGTLLRQIGTALTRDGWRGRYWRPRVLEDARRRSSAAPRSFGGTTVRNWPNSPSSGIKLHGDVSKDRRAAGYTWRGGVWPDTRPPSGRGLRPSRSI